MPQPLMLGSKNGLWTVLAMRSISENLGIPVLPFLKERQADLTGNISYYGYQKKF
ncbi:hypothetical protein ES703_74591 [subsurface metagenome]